MSCKEKIIKPIEANITCTEFFVKGQYEYGKYTFCGIVPIETKYTYKIGNWKFWNLKGQLIAEGPYDPQKMKIEQEGGCSYELTKGILNETEWKFWDDFGKQIELKQELITKIETCTSEIYD